MAILDKILGFFGIRRINLDKPLTLLGQYYYKVLDKIYSSAYGLEEDVDWGVIYYGYQEQDPNVIVCQWETIKIMNTVLHDETDRVVAAGRIYIDQDERFLEEIVKKVTSGKRRVHGKIHYRHFGMYDDLDEKYYYVNDDVYLLVYRESGRYDHGHSLIVQYVLRDQPKVSSRKPGKATKRPRTLGEDRQRIMNDLEKHIQ